MLKAKKARKLTLKYEMECNFTKASIRSLKVVYNEVKNFFSKLGSFINKKIIFKRFCRKVCKINDRIIKSSIKNKYHYIHLHIEYDKKRTKLICIDHYHNYKYMPINKSIFFNKDIDRDEIEYLHTYIMRYYHSLGYTCTGHKEESDKFFEYCIKIEWM